MLVWGRASREPALSEVEGSRRSEAPQPLPCGDGRLARPGGAKLRSRCLHHHLLRPRVTHGAEFVSAPSAAVGEQYPRPRSLGQNPTVPT